MWVIINRIYSISVKAAKGEDVFRITDVNINIDAVSYTHLDVYKRQLARSQG